MLGHRFVASAALVLLAAGCTTLAPEQSVAPTTSAAASPLAATTIVPSLEPSVAVTTPPPSVGVSTPRPSKSPKPPKVTPSASPAGPNLAVTKFVAQADPFVAGADAHGRVTIKNTGTADAGSFSLGVSYARDDGLGEGSYSGIPVDGLAAGDSVQVIVNITEPDAGAITFTATADTGNAVAESNENDNTATLSVSAVAAMPNLVFDSFTIKPDPNNAGKFVVDWEFRNAGTADISSEIDISTNWVNNVSNGTIPDQFCCSVEGVVLAAGVSSSITAVDVSLDGTGFYILTAALDPGKTIAESDETDNYATASINVP